ncbi:NAD-dependent epimerase/dehydratase family protein [Terribacillus saccharophilus]|uniref:SDR family oxidoreductase n=1 Tax=Terribacillus saccharophilus TaxID=361277 RepID=UPI003981953B
MLLVTGITGHTGSYFLEKLVENNYSGPIRCIVREGSDTTAIDNSGLLIEKKVGDLSDKNFLDKCMQGVDKVFHIVNIRYSLNILDACIRNNVNRLICVHTTGIFSKFRVASEEYNIIEEEINRKASSHDIKLTILRPTMIYGDIRDRNMSKFIKMIDKFAVFPVIDNGKCLIQPVNARDLGKAYYDVLLLDESVVKNEYILSGEKPIAMKDAFKLISAGLQKKRTFISVPLPLGVTLARMVRIITLSKIDYVEKVQRMGEDRCFDHRDAFSDFNYNPEPFHKGITREITEYIQRNR